MAFNTLLGKREICKMMLDHTAAKFALSSRLKILAEKYGYVAISVFGYPLDPVNRLRIRTVLRYLPAKGKILDVGCSFGVYDFELAKRNYDVTGIDTNIESIELANHIKKCLGFRNVRFIRSNILTNEFPAKQFNAIIMIEVLEHIREDDRAVRELNKILKNDGFIILSVPYAEEMEEYEDPVPACLTSGGTRVCIGKGGSHYRNGYNQEKLASLLESNGFTVMEWDYASMPKMLQKSMLWFPLTYPLSILFSPFWRKRLKLAAVAKKRAERVSI